MFSRQVRVLFKGEYHIIDIPCKPSHSIEQVKAFAISMLTIKEKKRQQRQSERNKWLLEQRFGIKL